MRRTLSILACVIALTVPADAADEDGNYFIMGETGALQCAEVNAKHNDEQIGAKIGQWMSGYLTAINRLTPKTYSVAPDPMDFLLKLFEQCEATPDMHLEPAAWEVAKKLYPARVQTLP